MSVLSPAGRKTEAATAGRTPAGGGLRRAALTILHVAEKDVRTELRARSFTQAALLFAVAAVLVFSFALGPERPRLQDVAPGLLWVAASFAAVFALGRSFAAERDDDTLETLLAFPVPREALFLGKLLANLAAVLALTSVALGLMFLLYGLPTPSDLPRLAAAVLLGSLGLSTAGTFYGALSARLAVREAFLPMLVLPIVVPLVIAASRATALALQGGSGEPWLGVLVAFDAVLLATATVLFPYLVEE
jgi:heme exporter protein B